MVPVAVHAGAGLLAGVEDDEGETLAPAPLVGVDDGDPAVHPPTASSKLTAATVAANRCLVFFN
jgi:hypothetical protein